MLIDPKSGKSVDPKSLPRDLRARERVLSGLREVFIVPRKHGSMFNLGERAHLVQGTK